MAEFVAQLASEIEWSLKWTDDPEDGPTSGLLAITIGGEEIWTTEDGDWPWIDLVRWLANRWEWLKAEEGPPTPLDANAESLRGLQASATQSTPQATNASLARAALSLWDFRETHDLSRALAGASTPPIVVWREGLMGVVLTEDARYQIPWRSLERSLVDIGNFIVERIAAANRKDPVDEYVTRAWRTRTVLDSGRLLSIARTQGQPSVVPLSAKWSDVSLGEVETSPLVAAARMTSSLPAPISETILSLLYEMPQISSAVHKTASAVAERTDLSGTHLPFEQAYELATAFRRVLQLEDDEPFDPESWLRSVGVLVRDVRLGIKNIEALAAWGPRNGPGVLLNLDGTASSSPSGRNASLAHEICHLMIDRTNALPAAEVLGGRVDTRVEQRARAFAAELLLPRSSAGARFAHLVDDSGARRAVNSLTSRFVVSREVVAWQARNSEVTLNPEVYEYLRGLVRYPDRF